MGHLFVDQSVCSDYSSELQVQGRLSICNRACACDQSLHPAIMLDHVDRACDGLALVFAAMTY